MQNNEHDKCMHGESILRHKVRTYDCKKQQLGLNCYGAIEVFKNGVLNLIENDKEFIGNEIIAEEGK